MERRNFERLVGQIGSVSEVLREDAKAVINRNVTARAWLTGYYIVEYEQHGQDRAKYGEGLLNALASRLKGQGMSLQNLKNFRRFYLTYPELMGPVVAYLAAFQGDRPSGWNFVVPEITSVAKGQSATVFFPKPGTATEKGQLATVFSESHEIVVQVGDELKISPYHLFGRLSFTHIVELLRLPDEIQRTFYAFETIRGTWSVKELRRQIDSQYYIRSGWSANPSKLSALTMEKAEKDTLRATLRSPAIIHLCHHLLHP